MRLLTSIGLVVLALLAVAASAQGAAQTAKVHFVHAVPGVGKAELQVDGEAVGAADFGEVTESVEVTAGPSKLDLAAPDGVSIQASENLAAGQSYTLVALATDKGAELVSFADESAQPSMARLRMVHGAPELGEPNLLLNGKTIVNEMKFSKATDYWTLKPGDYELVVQDPESGDEIVNQDVSLPAGTSQTALVVGSAGEETDVVLAQDDVSAPTAAPETGVTDVLGNQGGPNWILALIVGLATATAVFVGSRSLTQRLLP